MKYTTNSGLHAILRAISHYGIDTDKLLMREGIAAPSNSGLHAHIMPSLTDKLVRAALRETGDTAFPLRVAEYITPLTFGEFSIGLLTSSSMRNFIERFTRYYPFISTAQRLRLVERGDTVIVLSFFADDTVFKSTQAVWVEVTMAFMLRFMRIVGAPYYSPTMVEFILPTPAGAESRYTDYFGVMPQFGASRNAMFFAAEDLDTPFPNSNLEVVAEYEQRIVAKLAELQKGNLPMQIHAFLLEAVPNRKVSKEQVAQHFAMSTKTLQNRLNEAGTNYQFLLDSSKLELAEMFLSFPEKSLAEVADLLGYSDASNFCRAYKRWTGHLPREHS